MQAIDRPNPMRWRVWATSIAACAWTGLALQFWLLLARMGNVAEVVWRLLLFFTILSNLTVAVAFTLIALGSLRLRHPLLIAGLALTMALVGIVFELLLRKTLHLAGWGLVANALLHDAVPLLTLGAWLVLAEKGRLRARDPWIIALFPVTYLFYALIRGATEGLYPYPFLDLHKLGWQGVLPTVLGITVAFLIFGHLMVVLDRYLGRR